MSSDDADERRQVEELVRRIKIYLQDHELGDGLLMMKELNGAYEEGKPMSIFIKALREAARDDRRKAREYVEFAEALEEAVLRQHHLVN
jgi:hypothetical protein